MTQDDVPRDDPGNAGERLVLSAESEAWCVGIHISRYQHVAATIEPASDVLDYGCGTGYGTDLLAGATSGRCLGVDKAAAIEYARTKYTRPNLEFNIADVTLPESRFGKFDVIVSFEVIEHVDPVEMYLRNIHAQLRDDSSVAILSTPLSTAANNLYPLHNMHHVQEFTIAEYHELINTIFDVESINIAFGMYTILRRKGALDSPPSVQDMVLPIPGRYLIELGSAGDAHEDGLLIAQRQLADLNTVAEKLRAGDLGVASRRQVRELDAIDGLSSRSLTSDWTWSELISGDCNLAGVQVGLATYGSLANGVVQWALREGNEVIRTGERVGLTIVDNALTLFEFPALVDSRGKAYEIGLRESRGCTIGGLGVWYIGSVFVQQPCYRRMRWVGVPSIMQEKVLIPGETTLIGLGLPPSVPRFDGARSLKRPSPTVMIPNVGSRPWKTSDQLLRKGVVGLRYYGVRATLREVLNSARFVVAKRMLRRSESSEEKATE